MGWVGTYEWCSPIAIKQWCYAQLRPAIVALFFSCTLGQRPACMVLLLDIGNTHTHFAVAENGRLQSDGEVRTTEWNARGFPKNLRRIASNATKVALCSVVPAATKLIETATNRAGLPLFQLNHTTTRGVGI